MISKYDVIKSFDKAEERGERFALYLSDDKKSVLDSETHKVMCTIDEFVQYVRETEHCDFETVFYEHGTLTDIYRCRQCGTVIFGGDDERYDPNCKCPTCCHDDSVCQNDYWTKEEIENDPEKKKYIQFLEEEMRRMEEAEKRRQARGGLYDWQRWVKKIHTKNHHIEISYINFGWGEKGRKKDKYIEIMDYERDKDGSFLYGKSIGHCIKIPLSWYDVYIRWIFPYSKKCPEDMRRYYSWQKKPMKESEKGVAV